MNYLDEIQKIRGEIKERFTAFSTAWDQRTSRAELAALVDEQISGYAVTGAAGRKLAIDRLAAGQPARLFTVATTVHTEQGPCAVVLDMGPILTQLLGEKVMRRAVESALLDVPEGLTPAARELQITDLYAELNDLQTEEERLIRDAARAGQDIPRRVDADPAVVLALEAGA